MSYCWVSFSCWYHLWRSINFCSVLIFPSSIVVLSGMAAWNTIETSPTDFAKGTKSGNNKCTITGSVENLGVYQKKFWCPWRGWSHILSLIWLPLENPLGGVLTFDTWFKRIGFPHNCPCNCCNINRGGNASWNSKGAFGILENKVLVGMVVLDFFFRLEGFSTKLLFPGNSLDVHFIPKHIFGLMGPCNSHLVMNPMLGLR
jgi:hypothetical protein